MISARYLFALCTAALLTACGGGGASNNGSVPGTATTNTAPSTPSGPNVQVISVNGGPGGNANIAYTSVTICEPGTTQCVTIDNIQIDTGSSGLRILGSALGSLTLPQQVSVLGGPLAECIVFDDTTDVWGLVQIADIKIAGEAASATPIQIIGNISGVAEPTACNGGNTQNDLSTVTALGANGILGVGNFAQDCGLNCTSVQNNQIYYSCPATGCVATTATLASQVPNPVTNFSVDNNGIIIQLPTVPAAGVASIDGWLIFGIGTQTNNTIGSAAVFDVDSNGYLSTTYKGIKSTQSFIDTGSNGLFFNDSTIPTCATNAASYYCPTSTLSLSAEIVGTNNVSSTIGFNVVNADSVSSNLSAIAGLAGPFTSGSPDFDWGLPFFFGRKVYIATEGAGAPYIAF